MLDGGIFKIEDGGWRVAVWISNIPTEAEARMVSMWLEQLMTKNIGEIAEIDTSEETKQ
jgi:hypothetical protein